jgi:hypothetical protein
MLIGAPRGCETPEKRKFMEEVIRSIDKREEGEEKGGSEGDGSGRKRINKIVKDEKKKISKQNFKSYPSLYYSENHYT